MSKLVAPLAIKVCNVLQIIVGSMELGHLQSSLSACDGLDSGSQQIRAEIIRTIEQRHQEELQLIESLRGSLGREVA